MNIQKPQQDHSHRLQQQIAAISEQIEKDFFKKNLLQDKSSAQPQSCFVLLCPNNNIAQHVHQSLAEFFRRDAATNPLPLALIPGYMQAGVFRFESARRTIAKRLDALFKLSHSEKLILVTSITGWLRTCPSLNWIKSNILKIKLHDTVEQDELVSRLELMGYCIVTKVEEVGEFCIRGSILDVWPPSEPAPVRLEFFGDAIESIRHFKAADQRSTEKLEQIHLIPAKEFIWPTESELEQCLSRLNQFALSKGITGKVRADLLENLTHHVPFPGIDDVYPHFTSPGAISTWQQVLNEKAQSFSTPPCLYRLGSQQEYDEEIAEITRMYSVTLEGGNIKSSDTQKTYLAGDFAKIFPEFCSEPFHPEKTFASAPVNTIPDFLWQKLVFSEKQKITARAQMLGNLIGDPKGTGILLIGESRNSLIELIPLIQKHLPNSNIDLEMLADSSELNAFDSCWLIAEKLNAAELCPRLFLALGKFDGYFFLPNANVLAVSESWLRGVDRSSLNALCLATETVETENLQWKNADSASQASRQAAEMLMQANFGDFQEGDFVVHVQHGVARFKGLMTVKVMETSGDFLVLEYAGADKIYVPVHKFNLVQKYVGAAKNDDSLLDSLKGGNWEKKKARAREEAEKVAKELMEHQAKRATTPGHSFANISEDYVAFCAAFPYDETPDQLRATAEIMADMSKPAPMDRLLVGDVGFGKTEVAFRAAFRCLLDGKQVAWLAPTTVLAHQHFRSAKERFAGFSANIELLDRSSGSKAQNEVLQRLKKGDIDILIGTHRILSDDIVFRDLGLLVVDEEQRFGVLQKERIKTLSYGVDVLTMTATPIPRTLQMAMLGMRELSLLTTAPKSRLAVNTFVCPFDENVVKDAIVQELARGGQVFFVHNRVEDLASIESFLQGLVPQARICMGHGKMGQKELDTAIISFLEQSFDILLCTTIIESGIDMPNVNTILIQNAENFGLAQLYQLRGRVGRRSSRGYAYFLTSQDLSPESDGAKRLDVLREHQQLGSGFVIASHDLDMRGAGNILGDQQTGRSAEVGLETYSQMLDEAIRKLGGLKVVAQKEVELQIPIPFGIPEDYIANAKERLKMYRRFFGARTEEALENLTSECADRFGILPESVKNLSEIARLRRWLVTINATSLTVGEDLTELRLATEVLKGGGDEQTELLFKRILDVCNRHMKGVRLTPDGRILLSLRKKQFQPAFAQNALWELKKFVGLLAGDLDAANKQP